jgi:hypothetical protein
MYGLAVFYKSADYRVAIQVLNLQRFGALPKYHEDRTYIALASCEGKLFRIWHRR